MYFSVLHDTSDVYFFSLNDPAAAECYALSLHDAFRSSARLAAASLRASASASRRRAREAGSTMIGKHTSELQSQFHLVCRLLLEKKKIPYHLILCLIKETPRTSEYTESTMMCPDI